MTDPLHELDETYFVDCIALITAEARAQEGAPAPWDSKVLDTPTEHRLGRRRPVTRRIVLEIRRGTLWLGANLACGLVDVAEDGLGVRLKQELPVGQEVSLELSLPGVSKPLRMIAEVRWCRPAEDGTFRAGIRLRRRLPYTTLTDLTR